MQWPGGRILQRHELDAFLAQAVSSQLYEPDQLQELKVRSHCTLPHCWTNIVIVCVNRTYLLMSVKSQMRQTLKRGASKAGRIY